MFFFFFLIQKNKILFSYFLLTLLEYTIIVSIKIPNWLAVFGKTNYSSCDCSTYKLSHSLLHHYFFLSYYTYYIIYFYSEEFGVFLKWYAALRKQIVSNIILSP